MRFFSQLIANSKDWFVCLYVCKSETFNYIHLFLSIRSNNLTSLHTYINIAYDVILAFENLHLRGQTIVALYKRAVIICIGKNSTKLCVIFICVYINRKCQYFIYFLLLHKSSKKYVIFQSFQCQTNVVFI